ncbi:hypothetical protein J7L60_06920 [Candidatus Bathyarchaeota archaeon]|nr:hypothetical protein [Candidatus Bathyarchaeota archaeon]
MLKRLMNLIRWELESNLSFPIPELILFAFLTFSLGISSPGILARGSGLDELEQIFGAMLFLISVTVGPIFSHNIAREFTDRELITLLTQPVKKWMVLSAKLITNLLMLYIASALPLILETYLLLVEKPVQALPALLLTLLIYLLFVCGVVTAFALTTRSVTTTILGSLFLFLGLEFLASWTPSYKNVSPTQASLTILCFLENVLGGTSYKVSLSDFLEAFLFLFSLSTLLLASSIMYFHYIMELD